MNSDNWRVVLDAGEVCDVATDVEFTYDRKHWHTATFGRMTSGSYDGYYSAVVGLASMHKWTVREIVPPGQPTCAEAVDAAVKATRARCEAGVAEVNEEFLKRADSLRAMVGDADGDVAEGERIIGKACAYENAAEILRAEMAAAMRDGGGR